MSVLIGNARIDENGKASGGAAGDSTGKEVCIQNWYSYPWNTVVRAKSETVAEKIALAMEYACYNNHIGYDQSQRTTLYYQVKELGFAPKNIRSVGDCETDCSALVAVCVNCAGVTVSPNIYTGNEASALKATGYFEVLTDSKYLSSSAYLKRGDILINTVHHTAVVISDGDAVKAASKSGGTTTIPEINMGVYYDMAKTWQNGSTEEIVYADTNLNTKVGSLDPYEKGTCIGMKNGKYIVTYKVDGTDNRYKVGYVEYSGGVS